MENKTARISPALIWTTAVAVMVFCAAGVAAFMGWLPNSNAAHDNAIPEIPVKTASARPHVAAPERMAQARNESSPRSQPAARARCPECGVVESVRTIEARGEGSGLGAVGGAVAGGVLGHQVGGGRGQDLMTVVGAVGGALAGNEVEKRMKSSHGYAITIRMEDGTSRVMNQPGAPAWREGDRVKLVDGEIRSNG